MSTIRDVIFGLKHILVTLILVCMYCCRKEPTEDEIINNYVNGKQLERTQEEKTG